MMLDGAALVQTEDFAESAPPSLPVRINIGAEDNEPAMVVSLCPETALVYRTLPDGRQSQLNIPVSDFVGIGHLRQPDLSCIYLHHRDPSLRIPLSISFNGDLTTLSREWGLALNLPVFSAFSTMVGETCPAPRRRGSVFSGRRPRFLKRRKTGMAGYFPVYAEREITART